MATEIKRKSKQRDAILNYLQNTITHPTATDIYMEVKKTHPDVSLGTIYRDLSQLVASGQVITLKTGDNSVHYDGRLAPHSHFFCNCCGKIIDVLDDVYTLPNSLSQVNVKNVQTVYTGLCDKCK